MRVNLAIQENNPTLFKELKVMHSGKYLVEIAQRENGNSLYYVIRDSNYEKILWQRDNELNQDDGFIGSSICIML